MSEFTAAEINDLIRSVWCGLRVVLLDSLEHSPDRDAIVEAVRSYRFAPETGSGDDHSYAVFEHRGRSYYFSFDPDAGDGQPDGNLVLLKRVVTIGLVDARSKVA